MTETANQSGQSEQAVWHDVVGVVAGAIVNEIVSKTPAAPIAGLIANAVGGAVVVVLEHGVGTAEGGTDQVNNDVQMDQLSEAVRSYDDTKEEPPPTSDPFVAWGNEIEAVIGATGSIPALVSPTQDVWTELVDGHSEGSFLSTALTGGDIAVESFASGFHQEFVPLSEPSECGGAITGEEWKATVGETFHSTEHTTPLFEDEQIAAAPY